MTSQLSLLSAVPGSIHVTDQKIRKGYLFNTVLKVNTVYIPSVKMAASFFSEQKQIKWLNILTESVNTGCQSSSVRVIEKRKRQGVQIPDDDKEMIRLAVNFKRTKALLKKESIVHRMLDIHVSKYFSSYHRRNKL